MKENNSGSIPVKYLGSCITALRHHSASTCLHGHNPESGPAEDRRKGCSHRDWLVLLQDFGPVQDLDRGRLLYKQKGGGKVRSRYQPCPHLSNSDSYVTSEHLATTRTNLKYIYLLTAAGARCPVAIETNCCEADQTDPAPWAGIGGCARPRSQPCTPWSQPCTPWTTSKALR